MTKLLERYNTFFSGKTLNQVLISLDLPVLLSLLGTGIIALALGADLLGFGAEAGLGQKQLIILYGGIAVFVSGIVLDLTVGRRSTSTWLRQNVLDWQSAAKFFSVLGQLGLLVLVIRQFSLENQAFYHTVMSLVFYGFIIHYFLPKRFRLPSFLLLSLAGIVAVFGLPNGAWLIGIGLVLIGICHLPVAFTARIVILLMTGAFLAVFRVGWIESPWSGIIWPILGSMFMLRLIVYLYDLKNYKGPASFSLTLSYFFLLPNVVFPLFPVVDYSAFRRTYYNDDQFKIYQRGLTWIFWGTVHLIVYRAVNHYLTISPQEVGNVSDLARYMFANYLLYLRVSGQFHMIVGILHLFGFQLPRAYNLYYLASGFTDFWRRSNIYWKDFMQKVFFYPTYFRLRKVKGTTALILSTFVVFFVTWFLHAYQWFWLRAEFFTSAPDILFWVFLATFLTINMIRESKRGRKQTLRAQGKTFKEIASLSLRTIGMFVAMCVLWAFWTSPTLADWVALWSLAEITLPSLLGLIPAFVMLFLVFSVAHWLDAGGAKTWMKRTKGSKKPGFYRKAIVTGGMTLLLLVVGQPWFAARLGGRAQGVLTDMRLSRLSGRDAILLDRGYYENLIGVNQFNSQLWELYAKRPDDWPAIWETEAARLTDDFLKYELAPSVKFTYHGAAFSTNRWAMRDKDYEKTPLPDTFRIAFFGSSISMGSGVANDKTFEAIVEARLNQEQNTYAYEILNVSVGGYTALQKLAALETRALSFEPDALFYVPHPNHEKIRALLHLAEMVRLDIDLPFDYLEDIVVQAGIDANTPELAATKQLEPYGDEILSWAYGQIAEQSRQRGVLPVWVYVPSTPEYVENSEDAANMIRIAEEAGFIILDLSNAYDAQEDRTALFIAEWDFHPNGQGHQMLAESLYQALLENYDFIFTKPEDDSGG